MSVADPSFAPPDPKLMRKLMAAGLAGSSIEWYDFFIYGTAAALAFGKVFFPGASPLVGTMLSFSTFWAGFVARPLGGLVFGYLGDRIGRKPAVLICLVMVTGGTFLIGCLPSAAVIGVAAPILLVVLRFLQGVAVGGQWGGVVLLLTESAMPGRRGRSGSFGQMGVAGGVILSTAAFIVVAKIFPGQAFVTWGWRVPFLASALLLPVVIFIHRKIDETPEFRELQAAASDSPAEHVDKTPVRDVIVTEWRRILLGAGTVFSSNAFFYVSIAGLLDYGTRGLGLSRDSLLALALLGSSIKIFVPYFSGAASDRIGRKPLLVAGAAALAVWAFPFFWLVNTRSLFWIFIALLVAGVSASVLYGPYAAFLAELFHPNVRYSGMSIAYQLASILVSGPTPFIMTALLAKFGTTTSVSAFLLLIALISLLCALKLPETHRVGGTADTARGVVSGA